MRNLQSGLRRKTRHRALECGKTVHTGILFAAFKKKLVAETDAKVGTLVREPLLQRQPQTRFLKLPRGIAKRPLPWEHQQILFIEMLRQRHQRCHMPDRREGVDDAAEIASAVIENA